jgi:hypothetical protein
VASVRRQGGASLLIVLIAVIALALAGVALIRSVDTANVIAGNLAFRKAATQAADLGVEAAYAALPALILAGDTPVANQYYPTVTPANGGLVWDSVTGLPAVAWGSVTAITLPATLPAAFLAGYQVKYIIERLCTGALPVTNANKLARCMADLPMINRGVPGTQFPGVPALHYRVTVQVTGPRNTVSYVQAMFDAR